MAQETCSSIMFALTAILLSLGACTASTNLSRNDQLSNNRREVLSINLSPSTALVQKGDLMFSGTGGISFGVGLLISIIGWAVVGFTNADGDVTGWYLPVVIGFVVLLCTMNRKSESRQKWWW